MDALFLPSFYPLTTLFYLLPINLLIFLIIQTTVIWGLGYYSRNIIIFSLILPWSNFRCVKGTDSKFDYNVFTSWSVKTQNIVSLDCINHTFLFSLQFSLKFPTFPEMGFVVIWRDSQFSAHTQIYTCFRINVLTCAPTQLKDLGKHTHTHTCSFVWCSLMHIHYTVCTCR